MEVIGLAGGVCVLITFCMQSMLALRIFAIAGNVLFLVYAGGRHLLPILLLHAILLPINLWALKRLVSERQTNIERTEANTAMEQLSCNR